MLSGVLTQGPIFLVSLIVLMGVVVVVHELGHYLAGRVFGAAAESFSVGFGGSIFERKDRRGTRWRINWIPLGGFVKFVGEAQGPQDVGFIEQGPVGKPYNDLTAWQRIIVSLAGPVANFIFAAFLFAAMFLVNGSARESIEIQAVTPGNPAAVAGLQTGDVIVALNGKTVENRADFLVPIQLGAGKTLSVEIERNGERLTLALTPERRLRDNGLDQQVQMGVIGAEFLPVRLEPQRYGPIGAVAAGIVETGDTITMTVDMIGGIITGRESLSNLSGPIGIGDVSRRLVNRTMAIEQAPLSVRLQSLAWTAIQICALISVGIGLFNLLPFPILDGGHVVFHTYEIITGKALPEKIQEGALTVGFFMLIGLFVVVTWGDILETGVFTTPNQ